MQLRLFLAIALFLGWVSTSNSSAQTTYTWGANAGTAWATGTNWVGGTPAGSTTPTNNDIAQFQAGSTGTQMQMNFGILGSEYYLGTINILASNTVAKTMGANTATAGTVQLNGTGTNNLILSNASTSAFTLAPLAGGSGTGMNLRLNAANSEVAVTGTGSITISAPITEVVGGSAEALTKTGTGPMTLSGANTFTGGVTLNGGSLRLGNSAGLGLGTYTVTNSVTGGSNTTGFLVTTTLSNQTIANAIVMPAELSATTRTLLINGSAQTTTFSGAISGGNANSTIFLSTNSGDANGVFRFSGNNTYSGRFQLNRGTLQVDGPNALGNATVLIDTYANSAGTLQFNTTGTFNNAITFTNYVQNLMSVSAGNTASLSGLITNQRTDAFVKLGTGTLEFLNSSANALTTGLTINAGTVRFGNGGTTGSLDGIGNIVNNATLAFNRSDAVTVPNVISGSGAVNQIGTGSTTLSAANTFTGPLNVNQGTLVLGASASLATNTYNVNSGAILDVSSQSNYLFAGPSTLTIGRTTTPANDILGTTIIQGTLNVGGNATIATATFANDITFNGGVVRYDLANTTTIGGGVNDYINIVGNLNLSGTNTIAV
ncbi:MAG: beta strand repeat-containing protein, partial [Gemmataceae bacterium]